MMMKWKRKRMLPQLKIRQVYQDYQIMRWSMNNDCKEQDGNPYALVIKYQAIQDMSLGPTKYSLLRLFFNHLIHRCFTYGRTSQYEYRQCMFPCMTALAEDNCIKLWEERWIKSINLTRLPMNILDITIPLWLVRFAYFTQILIGHVGRSESVWPTL